MKKMNISKKVLAVLLSVIMIATSIPLGIMSIAADAVDKYDPAPYFSTEAQLEGARAWLDDDGNIQVVFPSAGLGASYAEYLTEIADDGKIAEDEKALRDDIPISFYILELVDMGEKSASHKNTVLDTIKVTGTSGTFAAADIGTIDLENKRYSVTVTAVDEENWFSQPIYTTVTEVPTFVYDAERYQVFTADTTAAREIMTYDSGTDDGVANGGVLQYLGSTPQVGVEDETGKDTNALRFMMRSQPTSTQTFDTSYSRQTWDYVGADEIWFWMDLTDVQLEGLAFRLRTNEKLWTERRKDSTQTTQRAGEIIYSTKGTTKAGYAGEDPYVWIQREDGGWKKVMLKADGTLDIGDFKGYIRVPLEFMCSETATYVDISNQDFGQQYSFTSGFTNSVNHDNVYSWLSGMIFSDKILVDPAGTNISDALLIHRRVYRSGSGFITSAGTQHLFMWDIDGYSCTEGGSAPDVDYSKVGYMLAVPLDESLATTNVATGGVSTDRAYIANGAIQNRDGGLKAIEDIYNAGFSIEGCSADSVDNSFYLDNVFFYRDDGDQWTDLSLSGYDANTGETMYNYYDQETVIATAIFDAIDEYISTPDWADYREVEYILDMIDGYKKAIEEANSKNENNADIETPISTDFLSFENLAIKSQELGRKSWQNAVEAYSACLNAGTIVVDPDTGEIICKANASKDQLLPTLVNQLEKLPHPDTIVSVSDALREYILEIWRAYSLLNLGQLEMLGKDEEDRILKYIALLDGVIDIDKEEFIVGQSLADRPFILFGDFENFEIGTQSYKLEDAPNIYNDGDSGSELYTDYRYTKNLVTYAPETFEDFGGKLSDTTNNIVANVLTYQPTKDGFNGSLKTKASWATITDEGFQGSKGATMYIDSQFYSSGEGVYNVLSTTYMGAEADNIDALRATGTGNASVKLGDLAKSFSNVEVSPYLSLVFYVDFTQLTDFNMSATIQTFFDGTLNDFQINMGTDAVDQNFFILDGDSGEWVQANNAADAGRMYAYTSKAGADTDGDGDFDITLAGYKGYVRIPLYHFKPGNNGQKLDESAEALNNIYRVSIGIAPGSAEAAVEMDGNTYTIDNIGFSYDPNAYSDGVASRESAGITDTYFDEFFGAKSLPAAEFEAAVDAIDPYDEATIDAAVANAEALHTALSEYQKGVVEDAYTTLLKYKDYSNDHSTIPQPDVSADSLAEWITNNLTTDATGAKIDGKEYDDEGNLKVDYDLMYPYYDVNENGQVVPNYGAYGLTADLATQLEEFYNESYIYYTVAEKDVVKGLGFLNAYNAAMRCSKSLEDIKQDSLTFLPEITALYTVKYDYNDDGVLDDKDNSVANSDEFKVGNFIQIGEKNADGEYEGVIEVSTFKTNEYNPLQYYSKTSIDDGTIYPQLTNTSRGFTYFLNNTREFTVDGETIEGGILTFQKKMQNVYDMANGHITNKTLFKDDELQSVRDVINEYNALLPAYYNIEELYELEQKILRLFPSTDSAISTTDLTLTPEATSASTTYSVNYAEYLDLGDETTTMYVKLTTKSENGVLTDGAGNPLEYKLKMGEFEVNASEVNGLTDDAWMGTYSVANNTYTPGAPLEFVITASVTQEQIEASKLVGTAYDEVIVEFLTSDGTVFDTQTIYVSYSMGDAYMVTIPASFPVDWDDSSAQNVTYTANTEMNAASSIKVKVSSDGTDVLTNSVNNTDVLYYETANFDVETTFSGRVTGGKQDPAPTVTVSGWDNVPVGEYRTTLTYTVVYEADDGTT